LEPIVGVIPFSPGSPLSPLGPYADAGMLIVLAADPSQVPVTAPVNVNAYGVGSLSDDVTNFFHEFQPLLDNELLKYKLSTLPCDKAICKELLLLLPGNDAVLSVI
jgi:hypothetical protein